MAKTSKITSVAFSHTWDNKTTGKTHYAHNIEFENGDKGEISPLSKDKYKVGEELTYDITSTDKGFKISAKQNPFQQAYGKLGNDKQRDAGLMVGNALTNAVNLVIADIKPIEELKSLADRICQISLELKEKYNK